MPPLATRRARLLVLLLSFSIDCLAMEAPFQQEIAAFEQQDLLAPPPADATLFLGSSTIRLWKTLAQDFPGIATVNRGFGGSQIEDSIRHADRIVRPCKPATIVFYAGDNDLASGKSPGQVCADYRRLVALLREALPDVRILFLSIKPSPARVRLLDAIRQANALIREDSRRDPRLAYVDVFTPMLDAQGAPRGELFTEDGLHMNSQGYALWTQILAPLLLPSANSPPRP